MNENIRTPSRFGARADHNCLSISYQLVLLSDTVLVITRYHWLDHVLTTTSGHSRIRDFYVLVGTITWNSFVN